MNFSFNKAIIDVQWALISIVTSSAAHFLLRIILGRELGPEGLGIYTLAFTIYLFGMQFAAFGIGSALTKYVAEFIDNQEKIKIFVSSGMTSSIVTGTLMGVILFFLSPFIAISFFHEPELEPLLKLIALCYPFIAIQKAVLGTLNGFRRMDLYAALNIVQNVTVVAISVAFVLLFGMGVFGALMGFVLPTILISFVCPFLIRDSLRLNKSSLWHFPTFWKTTAFGFYVVLGNSIVFLNTQVDSILIGYYLNPTEVGIFAVAVLLAQTLTLIPSAIQPVIAPVTATQCGKGNIEGVRKIIFSTMKKSFFFTIIISVILIIIGQYIINILFTNVFISSYYPLLILQLGYTIYAPIKSVGSTFGSIGKVHIPFRISIFIGFLNIVMNVLLIPRFGIIGAGLATTISLISSSLIFGLLLNVYTKEF